MVLVVPEDRSIHCFIGVFDAEKLGAIGRIEAFELLVEAYGENEVGLGHHEDLNDAYSMDRRGFLSQFKDAIVPPVLRRFESQHRPFAVSSQDPKILTFFDVKAGKPDGVVDH